MLKDISRVRVIGAWCAAVILIVACSTQSMQSLGRSRYRDFQLGGNLPSSEGAAREQGSLSAVTYQVPLTFTSVWSSRS